MTRSEISTLASYDKALVAHYIKAFGLVAVAAIGRRSLSPPCMIDVVDDHSRLDAPGSRLVWCASIADAKRLCVAAQAAAAAKYRLTIEGYLASPEQARAVIMATAEAMPMSVASNEEAMARIASALERVKLEYLGAKASGKFRMKNKAWSRDRQGGLPVPTYREFELGLLRGIIDQIAAKAR